MSFESIHNARGYVSPHSGAAAAALKLRAAAWDVPISETPGLLALELWGCRLELSDGGEGAGLRLSLSGPELRLVETLRDSATEIMNEAGLTIAWDRVNAGALAPGLSLVRVVSVTRRFSGFLRVRLAGGDLARFAHSDSFHFRLLIPPSDRAPVWPRVAPTGRTVWPQGPDALHRAVYTVASHGSDDDHGDWIETDIFLHHASPTCDWFSGDVIGREVGVLGPGGGGCPPARRLWLYGDETALPAISRILARTRGTATAVLSVSAGDLGVLADDGRVRLCDDLLTAFQHDDRIPSTDAHVWFAGRADQACAARAILLAEGWDRKQITCAAYWDQAARPA